MTRKSPAPPPGSAPDGPDLESLVSVRVVRLAEMMSRLASQFFEKEFGVRNTELRILVLLGRKEPLTINELARRAHIDKGWISRSLNAMAKRGLVRRTPHPTHRRQTIVVLTDQGQALLARIAPVAVARNERLLQGLSPETVHEVLDALIARVEAQLDDPGP